MAELISIVIPLYNKEKSVRTTLESVRAQSYTDWECIVVDDGSADHSYEVVEQFKIEDLRFKILSKPNGGVCSARNRGIQEAKSQYIAFLDADDLWKPTYLEEQIRMIHDFPEAGLWSMNFAETHEGKITNIYPTGLPVGFRGYVENYFEIPGRRSELAHPSSVVIRKEVFDKVGMWDERIRYSEDSDMWYRINAVYKTAFDDRVFVAYQQDAENRAMHRRRDMRYFFPYYVDKFKAPLFRQNKACYKYVNRWCAILIKRYYFSGDEQCKKEAKVAIGKLDFSVLPFKYRLFFHFPYRIANIIYRLDSKRKV